MAEYDPPWLLDPLQKIVGVHWGAHGHPVYPSGFGDYGPAITIAQNCLDLLHPDRWSTPWGAYDSAGEAMAAVEANANFGLGPGNWSNILWYWQGGTDEDTGCPTETLWTKPR